MEDRLRRLWPAWERTLALSWPIAVQQVLNTLMRTVDIVVTGLFSPAAIAAIGLADLYSDLPRQVGSAVGAGAITVASQETAREQTAMRDRAVTQALLVGFVLGLPFAVVGLVGASALIAMLGATEEVVGLGGTYLMIVFAIAPVRVVGYVGAKSLQGIGDTATPMYINGAANLFNIAGTVGLGLGLGPFPPLGIVGVGLATALSRCLETGLTLVAIGGRWTGLSFARPRDPTITRQLVAIGLPRLAEQTSRSVVAFPFNALLLLFGTEVNAGYHIARRIYQQLVGPVYRSLATASAIIVGQTLGRADAEEARAAGLAIVAFGLVVLLPASLGLYALATPLARVFTRDPATVAYATGFTRAFAVAVSMFGLLFPMVGGLRGAGDTRTPFYAQFVGQFAFMLGASYLLAVVLDLGLVGLYAGIVLTYGWRTVVVARAFLRGTWADTAARLIAERDAGDRSGR